MKVFKRCVMGALTAALLLCGCTHIDTPGDVLSAASLTQESSSKLQDGTYTAATKYLGPWGYGARLTVEVRQGIITKATFQEIDNQGNKRPDTSWEDSDISLRQVYAKLYSSFIENQSAEFDAVTGATETTDVFKALGLCVLTAATEGNTDTIATTDAYRQTYTAESQPNAQGLAGQLSVTYEDGVITNVTYDEYENSNSRSASVAVKQSFTAMAKETLNNQNLAPLSSSPGSAEETSRYNELLQVIAKQRVFFISN